MLLTESLLGTSSTAANYIEDVFSTYLYTGTGASQTITNGIDLSTKGGMVWLKDRTAANPAWIMDTTRGTSSTLQPSSTGAAGSISTAITAFGTTGFTLGTNSNSNTNNNKYVSWAFLEQPKFFDVVTYTGNGAGSRSIAHSLGTKPAWIMVKRTDSTSNWFHFAWNGIDGVGGFTARSLSLNSTNAAGITTSNGTNPHTATTFDTGEISDITGTNPNVNNATYVAYLFATNAGGFGAAGTDNVISCGSFTTNANGDLSLNLGWEPQWLVLKTTSAVGPWYQYDIMRGLPVTASSSSRLSLNTSAAEVTGAESIYPTPTGLTATGQLNGNTTYIYIAIRRGPMKTPTSGTSVFALTTYADGTGGAALAGSGGSWVNSRPDLSVFANRAGSSNNFQFADLLRGYQQTVGPGADTLTTPTLKTSSTAAESTSGNAIYVLPNNGSNPPEVRFASNSVGAKLGYIFRRAPGFFDVVCYTGNGVDDRLISHNLTVIPELIIAKNRSNAWNWAVFCSKFTNNGIDRYAFLNTSDSLQTGNVWSSTLSPTASNFPVSGNVYVNQTGSSHVAYLFATVAGVSKVGSYTGTGTTLQIDCGFTGGARFVMIKRTDSSGPWVVWDSARGIVAGNDPYLLLNTTDAEVTNTDYVDTYSAGFEISSTAPAAINASGGTFIFLAIA